MTLREGLRFHDGKPVLGRDVVASLKRWGVRDNFGSALFAVVDEVTAPTDRTVRFRLKSPFALDYCGSGTASSDCLAPPCRHEAGSGSSQPRCLHLRASRRPGAGWTWKRPTADRTGRLHAAARLPIFEPR